MLEREALTADALKATVARVTSGARPEWARIVRARLKAVAAGEPMVRLRLALREVGFQDYRQDRTLAALLDAPLDTRALAETFGGDDPRFNRLWGRGGASHLPATYVTTEPVSDSDTERQTDVIIGARWLAGFEPGLSYAAVAPVNDWG